MAKVELYLIDVFDEQKVLIDTSPIFEIGIKSDVIQMVFYNYDSDEIQHSIYLDKSTAIKFAKTLRTEINKIQKEGSNE